MSGVTTLIKAANTINNAGNILEASTTIDGVIDNIKSYTELEKEITLWRKRLGYPDPLEYDILDNGRVLARLKNPNKFSVDIMDKLKLPDFVNDISSMFAGVKINHLYLPKFNTIRVKYFDKLFWEADIISIDISNFELYNLVSAVSMFSGSTADYIKLPNAQAPNLKTMAYAFSYMPNLKYLDMTPLSVFNEVELTGLCFSSKSIRFLDLSNMKVSVVHSTKLEKVPKNVGSNNLDKLFQEENMFYARADYSYSTIFDIVAGCEKLETYVAPVFDIDVIGNKIDIWGDLPRSVKYFESDNIDYNNLEFYRSRMADWFECRDAGVAVLSDIVYSRDKIREYMTKNGSRYENV